jgi:uncharacterized protein (TIGR03663 family)
MRPMASLDPEALPGGSPPARPLSLPRPRDLAERLAAVRVGAWGAAFGSVTLLALVLRVVDLDNRPLHHDESAHAWFSWQLATGHGYSYDPVFHGPVQFYLMTVAYALAGVGDVGARLAPALVGTATVALPYFLRRRIGVVPAFAASCLLCISPSFLYYSRFAREDAYVACWDLLLLVFVAGFLGRPRRWHPAAVLGTVAVAFATKETTYITVFAVGSFLLAALALELWDMRAHGRPLREAGLVARARSLGVEAWVWGVATFLGVYTALFTTFFTNPEGLREGLYGSIEYWLGQQDVNRGDQPWFYYLIVVPAYEWPVLLFGVLGAVVVLRRRTLFGLLLVWLAVVQLAVYSWASERMPWLTLHVLLPFVLLAGIGIGAVWQARGRVAGRIGLALVALGAAFSLYTAFGLSYARPADPRELLVFVQSSTDITGVRREIAELDRRTLRTQGRHARIQLDAWGGAAWPWAWYLRDLPVNYVDLSTNPIDRTADAVVVADLNRPARLRELRGFRGHRFDLREWWVPGYGDASAADWARWITGRRTWSPRASLPEWLYVRR